MVIFLSSRYSRRDHLRAIRASLQSKGHQVTSRWLDSTWLLNETHEQQAAHCPVEFRDEGAVIDEEDINACNLFIAFTEPERGDRGGRHVEFGMALALGKRVVVVGFREHIFHYHPRVEFFSTVQEMYDAIFPTP